MEEMNGSKMNWNTVKKKTIVDLMLESFLHFLLIYSLISEFVLSFFSSDPNFKFKRTDKLI